MALPLEARSCLLFSRSNMDKDTSFAKDGGEPGLAAMGSAAFRCLPSSELLEPGTWEPESILLWLAPSRRRRTALQCHLEAAGAVLRNSRFRLWMWALGNCWAVAGTREVWKHVWLNCIRRRSFLGVWLDIQSPRSLSLGTATPLPRHPLMATTTQKAPEKARSHLQTSSLEQIETGEHVLQVTATHEMFAEWD